MASRWPKPVPEGPGRPEDSGSLLVARKVRDGVTGVSAHARTLAAFLEARGYSLWFRVGYGWWVAKADEPDPSQPGRTSAVIQHRRLEEVARWARSEFGGDAYHEAMR